MGGKPEAPLAVVRLWKVGALEGVLNELAMAARVQGKTWVLWGLAN